MADLVRSADGQHPTKPMVVAADNLHSSSDSEDPAALLHPVDAAREDEADDMVGVSIGFTQSRIKARLTPAEEKSRIMENNGDYFDDQGLFAPELTAEPESLSDDKHPPPAVSQMPPSAPSAAQQSPKDSGRSSFTRSILKTGLPLRPRAWSGDNNTINRSFKKFFPDLGSLTKRSSLSFLPGGSSQRRSRSLTWKSTSSRLNLDQEATAISSPSSQSPRRSSSSPDSASNSALAAAEDPIGDLKPLEPPSATTPAKHSFSRRPSTTPSASTLALRRLSSDQSLYLRASSTASSLDHRPQYENVHSQSNSRFKAIKDTLQDSSSRLLSMPTLHLQDLRSDWGYKPFLTDPNRRGGHHATTDESLQSDSTSPPPLSPQDRMRRELPSASLPRTRSPRTNSNIAASYPMLSEAMDDLTGDVVVMGGYRGSVLRSAKPPQRQLWVPMKVGLNLRKVDLEVGLTHEDEERMEETIIPSGVLSHIGPVDICRRLLKRLQKCDNAVRGDLRVWDYGYDWRLSPHLLSRRLIRYLEGLPCNAANVPPNKRGAYVIAHSLGGLITRHAVNQRPDLFAGVVYAGVPQHCVNILGPLRNGDDVLLSSRVLTAQVNFTFRTSFALLPEDGHCFIDKRTKEEYRVDFFNAKAWDEYHLSPCINPARPTTSSRSFGKRFSAVLSSKDSFFPSSQADELPDSVNGTGSEASKDTSTGGKLVTGIASGQSLSDKPSAFAPTADGVVGPSSMRGSSSIITSQAPVSTIPRAAAMEYLERTLSEVLCFKQELTFNPSHQSLNNYPPFAVLYSKSLPTVYGARVSSREKIKQNDAYDDLAFAAGDGVCLASAAMLPTGYRVIKHGLVKSDRGHVGLLGDLEGIGQCLRAVTRGRREGVGVGVIAASS